MSLRVSNVQISPRVATLIPSLGRNNDNEVLSTVRAIEAALKADGLDFHDLAQAIAGISPPDPPPASPTSSWSTPTSSSGIGSWTARHHAREARSDYDRAQWLTEYGSLLLNEREREFVHDLARRLGRYGGRATYRQVAWLNDLFARVARAAA